MAQPSTSVRPGSDPFFLVQEEIGKDIADLQARFSEWKGLSQRRVVTRGFDDVEEKLFWLGHELRQMILELLLDLEDLVETVKIVERDRSRFPIDDQELRRRRHLIRDYENIVFHIETQLSVAQGFDPQQQRRAPSISKRKFPPPSHAPRAPPRKNCNYLAERKELLGNHMAEIVDLEEEQEKHLASIAESVAIIGREGERMGEHLDKHNSFLDALNEQAENTGNGIKGAINQIDNFLESAAESSGFASIAALSATGVGLAAALVLL